jgi:hypothetical protein
MGGSAVNAIFGCLLSLGGGLLLIQNIVSREYRSLWLAVLLLSVGLFMLLRHRPDDEQLDLPEGHCSTCRGAGTVYSAEWNDWRKTGPVHNIRELCPSCQGLNVAEQPEVRP